MQVKSGQISAAAILCMLLSICSCHMKLMSAVIIMMMGATTKITFGTICLLLLHLFSCIFLHLFIFILFCFHLYLFVVFKCRHFRTLRCMHSLRKCIYASCCCCIVFPWTLKKNKTKKGVSATKNWEKKNRKQVVEIFCKHTLWVFPQQSAVVFNSFFRQEFKHCVCLIVKKCVKKCI